MKFRSIGLSLRFIVPLALVLALFGYLVIPLMDNFTVRWFVRDLDMRSQLLARTLQDPLVEYLPMRASKRIEQLFDRAIQDERLYAVGFCDPNGVLRYKTATYPASLGCWHPLVGDPEKKSLVRLPQGPVHVAESEITQDGVDLGRLILVHDMSFIERRSADTKKYILGVFALLALAISLITVVIAHLSWRGWISGVKEMLRGELMPRAKAETPPRCSRWPAMCARCCAITTSTARARAIPAASGPATP